MRRMWEREVGQGWFHQGGQAEVSVPQLWSSQQPQSNPARRFSRKAGSCAGGFGCAKQEGETNHIERFNLTLRQSVPRLVRKTLPFSKRHLWHDRFIRHFLVSYNIRKAKLYLRQLAKHSTATTQ